MNQLVLSVQDPRWRFSHHGQMSRALLDLGFTTDDTFSHAGHKHYHAGDRFLELMTFVGCAPVVMTGHESLEDENFYHIQLSEENAAPELLLSKDARPRCGKCKRPVDDWQTISQRYQQGEVAEPVNCPGCGVQHDLLSFNWRRAGGAVGVYIAVHGVFPHEAIPSDELMSYLQEISGQRWSYFYYY